ncbi:hypothetical protein MC28_0806 [Bacillus thuringiensis MC28]|nr:hypothetical protein MC28_0806 [Bacillus thuringiensis MC28]
MSWTNTFIESLKEWDEQCNPKDATLKDILFFLNYNIGGRDTFEDVTVEKLEERINYLVNKESFEEKFLIDSLIHETTAIFKKRIAGHGEAIIKDENLKHFIEQQGKDAGFVEKFLSKSKDMQYIYNAENQLDVWTVIVNQYFSLSNRRQLEMEYFQRLQEQSEHLQESLKGLPEEYKDVPLSELFKK